MKKNKIITSVVGAMLIAGITELSGFYPELVQIFTASNVLVTAVIAFIVGKE